MIEAQFLRLTEACRAVTDETPMLIPLPNGSHLISVPGWKLCAGWNRPSANVLFVAPVGYPMAQPDCFWVEPAGFRLADGTTPQACNDANPIPGDTAGRSTTWFSWHLQSWNPNQDSLKKFFDVIKARLDPPR